jgi:probable rRNA maturation factor
MRMSSTRPAPASERRAAVGRGLNSPQLTLSVQYGVRPNGLPDARTLRKWAKAALLENARVTLRLIDEFEARTLNGFYRNKSHATNVLTFCYTGSPDISGDIAICIPVVENEARIQNKLLHEHLAHLVVHGMLHLQGFDHEERLDAELMEGIETEIVSKLGYADPYRQG